MNDRHGVFLSNGNRKENNLKIYLANGLFTKADRMYNDDICKKLDAAGLSYYAPQRNASINDKTKPATSEPIYQADTNELLSSDVILVVLDGQDIGVATEVGVVAGYNEKIAKDLSNSADPKVRYNQKVMIGIYTDNRDYSATVSDAKNESIKAAGIAESQYSYINLYLIGAIKKYGCICNNEDDAIKKILQYQKWRNNGSTSNTSTTKDMPGNKSTKAVNPASNCEKYTKEVLLKYDKQKLIQILTDLGHPKGKRGRGQKDPLRPVALDSIADLVDKILKAQESSLSN